MNDSDLVACNGAKIGEYRKLAEWTQEQLAEFTGYSVRVIRKAEKGGNLRYSTLTAIATAFQRGQLDVCPGDLCTDPLAVVQAFVEAYRVHEDKMVDQIRHLLSEDLEVFIAGDPNMIPFAGTYSGPDGLQEFWNRFFALLERPDKTALSLQYFVCGHEVVAYGTEQGRIKGLDTDAPSWLSLKFDVRGGQIVRFEDYFDTGAAQAYVQAFQQKMERDADDDRTTES